MRRAEKGWGLRKTFKQKSQAGTIHHTTCKKYSRVIPALLYQFRWWDAKHERRKAQILGRGLRDCKVWRMLKKTCYVNAKYRWQIPKISEVERVGLSNSRRAKKTLSLLSYLLRAHTFNMKQISDCLGDELVGTKLWPNNAFLNMRYAVGPRNC